MFPKDNWAAMDRFAVCLLW